MDVCRSKMEGGGEELPPEGGLPGEPTPGWLDELTESNVGRLEREEDCGLSDAGEGQTLLGCGCC